MTKAKQRQYAKKLDGNCQNLLQKKEKRPKSFVTTLVNADDIRKHLIRKRQPQLAWWANYLEPIPKIGLGSTKLELVVEIMFKKQAEAKGYEREVWTSALQFVLENEPKKPESKTPEPKKPRRTGKLNKKDTHKKESGWPGKLEEEVTRQRLLNYLNPFRDGATWGTVH